MDFIPGPDWNMKTVGQMLPLKPSNTPEGYERVFGGKVQTNDMMLYERDADADRTIWVSPIAEEIGQDVVHFLGVARRV